MGREPYVGPRPFSHDDRDIFFGRDAEIAEIVSLVIANRSVLLYSVSGAGKSSLLRAGVETALVDQGFEVLGPARFQSPVAPPADARNAYSYALVHELRAVLEVREDENDAATPSISELLASFPRGTDTYGFPTPRALIVDQFEEVFTLYQDRWDQRPALLQELADALEHDPQLRILISMREEYIAQLERYAELLPSLLRARFHLERLRAPAALTAVTGPLASLGVDFAPGVAETLVHDLRETRIDVGRGAPLRIEGEFVEPVQLQVVCRTLWLRLSRSIRLITASHLAALGNVDDALSQYYDNAIRAAAAKASVHEHTLREVLERSMITSAGTRATVFAGDPATAVMSPAALEELARQHLVRAEWRAGARWFELTHDRLIEPIRRSNAAVLERHRSRRLRRLAVAGAVLIAVLVLGVIAVSRIWYSKQIVPDVVGKASVFEAGRTITGSGLTLAGNVRERVDARASPGSVVAQTPPSGTRVKAGTTVAVAIAIGNGKVEVPSVVGRTLARADAVLHAAALSLGQASPPPVAANSVVASQIPAVGAIVKQGTAIAVFIATIAGQNGRATVPALKPGDTAAGVATSLASRGLVPSTVSAFDVANPGSVIRTDPPPGTRLKAGQAVTIVVSAGFPQLAFDNGRDVLLANGANGRRLGAVAKGPPRNTGPSFSADGAELAFVRGGRVFLANQVKPGGRIVPLTQPGARYGGVAWAPTVNANVLAMVRERGHPSDGDLCLGRIGAGKVTPQCISDPDVNLGGVVRWAPDGRSIFALGVKGAGTFGLVRYTSKTPSSSAARDWGTGTFVTDISRPDRGVIDMAIAPDGKRAAFVANFDGGVFQLYFATATDYMLADARAQGVGACKVAWRPDSKEVVVVQADGACAESSGRLVRISPDNPRTRTTVELSGDNPVFQPLIPTGP